MTRVRSLAVLLALSVLTSCAAVRPQPPDVQLAGLQITDLSLTHANFLARLKLFNPNRFPLAIDGLDFTLHLDDLQVASGATAQAFEIPAEAYGEAAMRLSSSYLKLLQLSGLLQAEEDIRYRISGEIRIGGRGLIGGVIPVEHEGVLPLKGSLDRLRPGRLQPLPGQRLGPSWETPPEQ